VNPNLTPSQLEVIGKAMVNVRKTQVEGVTVGPGACPRRCLLTSTCQFTRSVPVYPYTLAASSSLAWPLVPSPAHTLVHSEQAIRWSVRPSAAVSCVHVETPEYYPGMSTCCKDVLDFTNSDVMLMAVSYMHGKKNPYRHVSIIGRAKPVKTVGSLT